MKFPCDCYPDTGTFYSQKYSPNKRIVTIQHGDNPEARREFPVPVDPRAFERWLDEVHRYGAKA